MSDADFDDFCRHAIDFLTDARVPYVVVGGLAVAAVGEPRFTADMDVIAFVDMNAAEQLIASASSAGFDAASDELERLRATGTLRFHRGRFQLDVIIASLPFEERARGRAVSQLLFDREVPLPTPEDLLLFKVISGRDKDILDAVGILRRHARSIDWAYVTSGIDEISELADQAGPREMLAIVKKKAGVI